MNNHGNPQSEVAHRLPALLRATLSVFLIASFCDAAIAEDAGSATRREPASAIATAEAFNDAIAKGNSAAARALLMPAVLIFESGEAETSAEEYIGHHLAADIAFIAAMKTERLSRKSDGDGTTSWVATKSRVRGQYKGKAVDLDSTETLVLTMTSAGWRIAHIHWSSSPHHGGTPTK